MEAGVELQGICLYPIVDHPGWEDDRRCHNGLWDYTNEKGEREIYQPLADEPQNQRNSFKNCCRVENLSDASLGHRWRRLHRERRR